MRYVNIFLLILLGSLFYSCCRISTFNCPDGPRYTNFFNHNQPDNILFIGTQGDSIGLDLNSVYEVNAQSYDYNECDSKPICSMNANYHYGSYLPNDSLSIVVGYTGPTWLGIRVGVGSAPTVNFQLRFEPLDLTYSGPLTVMSLHGSRILGGTEYENVYQAHFLETSDRVHDVYFSRDEGIIQLVLEVDNEVVEYTKS